MKFKVLLVLSMTTLSIPLVAGPGPGIPIPGGPGHPSRPSRCYAYNRDGVTCQQVGFSEGQIGYPWGVSIGKFQCVDSCLRYLGH